MPIDPQIQAFAHSAVALTRAWDESRRQLAAAFEVALASDFAERQLDADTTAMFTVHPDDQRTEYVTTYAIVNGAVRDYVLSRSESRPDAPVDLRGTITQLQLIDAVARALVGGEAKQPEWERPELTLDERADARRVDAVITALRQCGVVSGVSEKDIAGAILFRLSKVDRDEQAPLADWEREILEKTAKFPDVATSTSHAHRDREAVIRDALYEAIGDAADAAALARVTDDALISAGFGTSPLVARLASMAAPCQLVMDVLVQYGIHTDGPYGDQGRMNVAVAVAGRLVGTDFHEHEVRVAATRAALAETYDGMADFPAAAEDIVTALETAAGR